MSRKKLFAENIFAYGFINILNRVIPFLLLPIITRLLPDASDFGVYSMYTTIVGFGTPIAVLGLYDAMFREFFEKDDIQYKYNVTTTTQRMVLFSSLVAFFILLLLNKFFSNVFFGHMKHGNIVILAGIGVLLGGITSPIQAPTRIQNQRRIFIVSGILSSLVTYLLALVLIYYRFSYYGLIYSSIISSTVILVYFGIINRKFFTKGFFDTSIAKELLKIGLPILPGFLIYWIYDSMDKIMITNMLSTFELGIYSIGSKMGQISQLIYAGFAGGWQYFAFSTMKDEDQVELNSKIFEFLATITVVSFIIVFPFIKLFFEMLFTGDYVYGYIVAPYLYLSPLSLMLFQVIANQFLVVKKSYLSTLVLSIGASINVVLNLVLIRVIGIEGAALSTLVGYFATVILVMVVSNNMRLMQYSRRVIYCLVMVPIYLFLQRVIFDESLSVQVVIMLTSVVIVFYFYRNECITLIRKIMIKK